MNKLIIIFSVFFLSISSNAQELNCSVIVNSDRLPDGSNQIFRTLEKSLDEFVNQTTWTDKTFKQQERIECSMILTILKQSGSNYFSGNIQVQSSRPVYNSIYTTPIFNYQDNDLNFSYTEFEPLRYDKSVFQSDIVSIISYYVYLILALDNDSFEMYGGTDYYEICERITDQVEDPNNKKGWKSDTNKLNRYNLLKEIQTRVNRNYRKVLYDYHLNGLDKMESNKKDAKTAILNAVLSMENIYENNMTSFMLRIFMDAKADEIVQIFSDGPNMDTRNLLNTLNKISPTNAEKWANIKN